MIEAMCWMEAYWPVDDQTSQLHLILHLPQQIIREFGPLQESWMFPYKGFIGILKGTRDLAFIELDLSLFSTSTVRPACRFGLEASTLHN